MRGARPDVFGIASGSRQRDVVSDADTGTAGRSDDGLLAQRRGGRAVREGEEPIRLGARRPRGLDVERAAGCCHDERDAERRSDGCSRPRDGSRAITDAGAVAAGGVLVAGTVMGRPLVVLRPAGHRSVGRPVANHRSQSVHVALETLGVAEAHLAQKSQVDEDTAEAEQQGRGTTHVTDAMRVGRHAKGRHPATTQTERRRGLFLGVAVRYLPTGQ